MAKSTAQTLKSHVVSGSIFDNGWFFWVIDLTCFSFAFVVGIYGYCRCSKNRDKNLIERFANFTKKPLLCDDDDSDQLLGETPILTVKSKAQKKREKKENEEKLAKE
jgi:hypothetical protein